VSLLNKTQSKLQIIDSNRFFQAGVIAVILLSALTIGVNTHVDDSLNVFGGIDVLGLLDICITVFFIFEITIFDNLYIL